MKSKNCLFLQAALSTVLLAGTLLSRSTQAATIDFNLLSGYLGTSFVSGGVTFSTSGVGGISAELTPNGTTGLLEDSIPRQFIRATIPGGASLVSVDLGDFDSDADTIFLQIFDSTNTSLGYTSQYLDASFIGMQTLSLSSPGIAYAVFGSIAPSINGSSVFADNFTYVVPEPSVLSLMVAGLSAFTLAARGRKD